MYRSVLHSISILQHNELCEVYQKAAEEEIRLLLSCSTGLFLSMLVLTILQYNVCIKRLIYCNTAQQRLLLHRLIGSLIDS